MCCIQLHGIVFAYAEMNETDRCFPTPLHRVVSAYAEMNETDRCFATPLLFPSDLSQIDNLMP